MFGVRPKFDSFFFVFLVDSTIVLNSSSSLDLRIRAWAQIFLHIKLEQKTKFKFQVFTSSLLLSFWGVLRSLGVSRPSPFFYTNKSIGNTLLRLKIHIQIWIQALPLYFVKP
jgi:hypothetical protein